MSTTNTRASVEVVESPGTEEPEEHLSKDDIFHILQNERRRRVLLFLRGREGRVDMSDIAEQVSAWEHDTTVQALTSKERQRVYIALYQSHLPKLKKAGLIEYNQNRGHVELLPAADVVMPYLEAAADDGEPVADDEDRIDEVADVQGSSPSTHVVVPYAAATVLSVALIGAAWAGFTVLPNLALASIITGLYALVTAFVVWSTTTDTGVRLGE